MTLQSRLIENIAQARRYGDTDARKADRAQTIDVLNGIALEACGTSYNSLCHPQRSGPRTRETDADFSKLTMGELRRRAKDGDPEARAQLLTIQNSIREAFEPPLLATQLAFQRMSQQWQEHVAGLFAAAALQPQTLDLPMPIIAPAPAVPGPTVADLQTEIRQLRAEVRDLRGAVESTRIAVLERYDTSEKRIISTFVERLDQQQLATVQAVLDAVEQNRMPEAEMCEVLDAAQKVFTAMSEHGMKLPNQASIAEAFAQPTVDVKAKLKVTLPIIPFILSYEGEVGVSSGVNLEKLWRRLASKIRAKK